MNAPRFFSIVWAALSLTAALVPARAVAAKGDDAYQKARAEYLKLKGDEKARKFRHNWLNTQKKLLKAAQGLGAADVGAEAYFTLGELDADLYRFSGQREDVESATDAFEKVTARWPQHRLADDAALLRAKLLEQTGDTGAARKALENAPDGDKKKEIAAQLQKLPKSTASKAEARAEKSSEKAERASDDDEKPDTAAKSSGKAEKPEIAEKSSGKAEKAEIAEKSSAKAEKAETAEKSSGKRDDKALAGRTAALEKLVAGAKASTPKLAAEASAKKGDKAADGAPAAKKPARDDAEASASPKKSAELAAAAKKAAHDDADAAKKSNDATAAAKKPGRSDDVEHLGADDRSAMGEAIRRAILTHDGPTRDGRRLAAEDARPTPAIPRREPERLSEDEDEPSGGLHLPKLSELQERLRDVRVGPAPKPVPITDDPRTRSRLKQIAKDEQGAELTLAEQLGLKMRRVIIDAGHGGHDTGAIGPTGVQEKDVALAIALKTAKKLQDAGLEVVLTRDDDTFVRLEDRSKIANQQRGDLFVSIHCNAAPARSLRGVETYSLNTSSDHYSARLAARENATAERGVSDLQVILADLATKMNTTESQRLASRVQRSMVSTLSEKNKSLRDLGTKEALFYVLLGARMPSILVETSFISNPEEEKLLDSDGYQAEVASAIAGAVEAYVGDRDEKLAKME